MARCKWCRLGICTKIMHQHEDDYGNSTDQIETLEKKVAEITQDRDDWCESSTRESEKVVELALKVAELEAENKQLKINANLDGASLAWSRDDVQKLTDENGVYREVINDFKYLIKDSDGVTGLHLNGDIATWEELLEGTWLENLQALNDGG